MYGNQEKKFIPKSGANLERALKNRIIIIIEDTNILI